VNQPLGGQYGRGLLDPTAAQVLIATLPRRAIHLTGKGAPKPVLIDKSEVQDAIAAGRWRLANTDQMSVDELIDELDCWSPIAREWIAKSLAKKEGDFTARLIEMLDDENPEARAGACAALGYLGERATEAVPQISKALSDESSIVCISAGYALARIGKPSRLALPDLLGAITESQEEALMKPKQQALAFSLGYASGRYAPLYFDGVLPQVALDGNPLEGLDRQVLYPAITKLLDDPSGRTRGCGAYAFAFFSREDTAMMAQEIYDTIKTPAMNYLMFDDDPRRCGLELLARFRIKEGIPLCMETFDLGRWGAYARLPARFNTLKTYAGSAKSVLPQLYQMRTVWKSGEHRDSLEETIEIIEKDDNPQPLISIHDLVDERFAGDLAEVADGDPSVALCRQLMKTHSDDFFYQAAGLRKIVAVCGEDAFDDLLAAITQPNEILRETVVILAADLKGKGMTDRWIGELKSAQGDRLVGICGILAARKDPRALPELRKYIEHMDEAVRAAAVSAVEALSKP